MTHTEPPKIERVMLTIHEVAGMLQVTPRHVTRMVKRGEFPVPVRLGRSIRWPITAVNCWVAEKVKQSLPELQNDIAW